MPFSSAYLEKTRLTARRNPVDVCTSFPGIDIIYEGVDIFRVRGIVLHGHFYLNIVFFSRYVDRVLDEGLLAFILGNGQTHA